MILSKDSFLPFVLNFILFFSLLLNQNVNGEIFTSVGQMITLVKTQQTVTQHLEDFIKSHEKSLNEAKKYSNYYPFQNFTLEII
jgi:hypothetical protein